MQSACNAGSLHWELASALAWHFTRRLETYSPFILPMQTPSKLHAEFRLDWGSSKVNMAPYYKGRILFYFYFHFKSEVGASAH